MYLTFKSRNILTLQIFQISLRNFCVLLFEMFSLSFHLSTLTAAHIHSLHLLTFLDEICQDPVHEVGDPGVDPRVAGLRAPVPEADDAYQEPGSGLCVIEHQGAATVTLTRVPAPVSITRTQKHLSDRLEIRLEQGN